MLGRSAAKQVLKQSIPAMERSEIDRQLDQRLPSIIEDILADRFKNRPDNPLSEVGFNWALALSLRALWPNVTNAEAVRWLREYIDTPHGAAGYDWTPSAAKLIAYEYVNEVGEVA
jgi:hypothetical protein